MLGRPASNARIPASSELYGRHEIVIRVILGPMSSKVVVASISSGQSGAMGLRASPPSLSEKDWMQMIAYRTSPDVSVERRKTCNQKGAHWLSSEAKR